MHPHGVTYVQMSRRTRTDRRSLVIGHWSSQAVADEWYAFLARNKITAADFGQSGKPVPSTKRWQLKTLAEKKLFYWSVRFSSFSSAQAFARATVALEGATAKGAPFYVNFNNFAGRGYVPGPVGNNRDRTDPNAAMLSLDWFEFGQSQKSCISTIVEQKLGVSILL